MTATCKVNVYYDHRISGTTDTPPSRRERLRAQTVAEIREHADAQIAAGGAAALSLNGIAKAMGMSGPALYRYFDSRDALLSALLSESYEALADALDDAYEQTRRRAPQSRLRVTLEHYRIWALDHPHRYRLLFTSGYGSGALDPGRIVPAAQRVMDVVLEALAGVGPPSATVSPPALRHQLCRWAATGAHADASPERLLLGQQAWSRLHGIVSLEIEGVYGQMQIDAAAIYADEVTRIVARAAGVDGDRRPR